MLNNSHSFLPCSRSQFFFIIVYFSLCVLCNLDAAALSQFTLSSAKNSKEYFMKSNSESFCLIPYRGGEKSTTHNQSRVRALLQIRQSIYLVIQLPFIFCRRERAGAQNVKAILFNFSSSRLYFAILSRSTSSNVRRWGKVPTIPSLNIHNSAFSLWRFRQFFYRPLPRHGRSMENSFH